MGGATTRLRDGGKGFIVHPTIRGRFADAMLRLARGRALNQRMGEAAHQRGASSNTWQDYGDRLLAEYARRLNSKPR